MCGIIISKMNYFDRARYFRTKKRLGQNFLVDGEVIQDIIDFAQITPDDTVLEIGPGVGFVTEQLVKHAKKVIAIELDEEAIAELKKLEAPNLEIIHNDVLKTDLSNLTNEKFKVVANIPYYITSPIIAHLLGEIDDLLYHLFVLMNQTDLSLEEVRKKARERHQIEGNKKEFHTRTAD